MKVCFVYADKISSESQREKILADAFLAGVERIGDEAILMAKTSKPDFSNGADVYCLVGVKSATWFRAARKAGRHTVTLDKGYFRHRGPHRTWEYWRVSVNGHHPIKYLRMAHHSSKRWDKIAKMRAVSLLPWRANGSHILIAASSAKYHDFCGLPDPTTWTKETVAELREYTDRPIIYRPKPSWQDAVPIKKTTFSPPTQNLGDVLENAWCLVTYGSNACFEAAMGGVPSIITGNGIAGPISSTMLSDVESPRLCSPGERLEWLYNVAWCMFTEAEMESGLAWAVIRPQFEGLVASEDDLPAETALPTKKVTKAQKKKLRIFLKNNRTI